jgi:midasin
MDVDLDNNPASLISTIPNVSVREAIFIEARDIFFGAGASTSAGKSHLNALASVIAQQLGIDNERREFLLHQRVPEFRIEKDTNGRNTAVVAGQTRLLASPRITIAPISTPSRPFAMHRPATVLMSRLASAISQREPILLTGETGTGKTSIVTHLSSLLNRNLISLNLSQQTESSDLLGGFKPVNARGPASMLQETFIELFGGTFSRRKNEKFEGEVRKAVGEAKWKRAVALWKESIRLAKERIRSKEEGERSVYKNFKLICGH